jgi:predicted acetyltransferase
VPTSTSPFVSAVPASFRVAVATKSDRVLLERLWLMFRHDMSQFRAVLPSRDGSFRSDRLDTALGDPGWVVYVLWLGDNPAGLALVRGIDEPRRIISSFFVVRGARKTGVSAAAVRAICAAHPGQWGVAFQDANTTAVAFWRRAAEAADPGAWTETRRPVDGQPDLPPDVWIEWDA